MTQKMMTITVPPKPNYYFEAVQLMYQYFTWDQGHEGDSWTDLSLVRKQENFNMALEEVDKEFPDMVEYLRCCIGAKKFLLIRTL